ncbi:MAG: Transcriptional regulator, XRE family [Candidatus Collierbacteria bacterium GW2011_GWB1_44_6]|uniref:Transcriptional regulator, XRE family n=1 Tax=Candidatus Collierbacteria bacterium GW2011_GWB1_44_6 TaxID=1618384 RepID=A0A0G1JPF2_9BACT|nr:MAG: Transcriptional regulator, XRE family [Candidatus Collierbacteria bacterium GW2011_GWB1_44_6]
MKTVGQIIRTARQKRGLSIDQLSSLTKIDGKYINALEQDNYSSLPSETFAKGFIRNLSLRLDLNPSELVAIFRRDFKHPEQKVPSKRHQRFVLQGITSQILPFALGCVAFIVYLIFQFRAIVVPPKLTISQPGDGSVLVSPVEISGDTAVDALVYINEEIKVKPDSSGHFFTRINLPVGETEIGIKATNRFSRSSSKILKITIISK